MTTHADIVSDLLEELGASRVTLRRDVPGATAFPVVEEALAPGTSSLRCETTVHLPTQPVVLEVQAGRQVVQDDCRNAYDDPAFKQMLDTYGGLAAQIVTPVMVDCRLVAILSVHQLEAPRSWTAKEIDTASRAAARIGEIS